MGQFIILLPLIISLVNLAEKIFVGGGKGVVKRGFVLGAMEAGADAIAAEAGAVVQPVEGWGVTVGKIVDAVVSGQNSSGGFQGGE